MLVQVCLCTLSVYSFSFIHLVLQYKNKKPPPPHLLSSIFCVFSCCLHYPSHLANLPGLEMSNAPVLQHVLLQSIWTLVQFAFLMSLLLLPLYMHRPTVYLCNKICKRIVIFGPDFKRKCVQKVAEMTYGRDDNIFILQTTYCYGGNSLNYSLALIVSLNGDLLGFFPLICSMNDPCTHLAA